MNLKEQQEQFEIIIDEVKQTMFKKGNDYANEDICSTKLFVFNSYKGGKAWSINTRSKT